MLQHLRDYQKPHFEEALRILNRRRALLDASDTGTGKTYVAIALAKARGNVPLVVAPKAVLASWDRVAARLGHEVVGISYDIARGNRAKKGAKSRVIDVVDQVTGDTNSITRRYSVSDFGEEVAWGKGSFWRWKDAVEEALFDEAQLCGGGTTLNSKMLIAAKRQFGSVSLLSATLADSPLQLKAAGYVLGLHDLKNYRDWLYDNGCRPAWAGGWEFGDEDDPEVGKAYMARIHATLFPERGVRLRKTEIPGFPQSQISTIMLDCSADERALLDKCEQEMREVGATKHFAKLELALVDRVVDLAKNYEGKPQLVFVNFRETAWALSKKLKSPVIWGDGDQSDHVRKLEERFGDRQKVIDDFQANLHPYVVATYGAGGPGISLHDPLGQSGRTTWMLPTFDARMLFQATGRVWRDGGGWSDQFLVGLSGTYHNEVLEVVAGKLQRLDVLNDGALLRG